MFGLGPVYVFFISQRVPLGMMRQGWRPWASVMGNGCDPCSRAWAASSGCFGLAPVLIVNVVTMLLAATIGVWLFYVQHQFEGAVWTRNAD